MGATPAWPFLGTLIHYMFVLQRSPNGCPPPKYKQKKE
jgi:hypothetical protein